MGHYHKVTTKTRREIDIEMALLMVKGLDRHDQRKRTRAGREQFITHLKALARQLARLLEETP